ncbi:arginine deiminase-related protein [Pseudomonas sp. MAHUQ-62]|uniref:arginine deiminase-related protein n=1 Tax=Pseudomonas sp. GCM10023245 TaxID=3252652 RepID=UPI0036167059
MPRSAWKLLQSVQRGQIERHAHPVVVNIDHLERIGGDSSRCMLAEVHLPTRH